MIVFSGTVVVSRIRITGGKHFRLNHIEIRTKTLRTDFDLTIPQLNANGKLIFLFIE